LCTGLTVQAALVIRGFLFVTKFGIHGYFP